MTDPVRGLSEMRRVVRRGGLVAACAWDLHHGPVQVLWRAADELFPGASAAIDLPGARDGQLAELMTTAGLEVQLSTTLSVRVQIATFEEWWAPFSFGIGPAGEYVVHADGRRPGAAAGAMSSSCCRTSRSRSSGSPASRRPVAPRGQPADSDIGP